MLSRRYIDSAGGGEILYIVRTNTARRPPGLSRGLIVILMVTADVEVPMVNSLAIRDRPTLQSLTR